MSDALTAWFASMKSGTAKGLEAVAMALPGVRLARALQDPGDSTRVVMLVDSAEEVSPRSIEAALMEHAAAGAIVEVIRITP